MSFTLPSASFNAAGTIFGTKAIAVFTPSGGSPVNIIGKVLELDATSKTTTRMSPGTDNVNRPDRECLTEATEMFTFTEIEEIDAVLAVTGGFTGVNKTGTCVLYICDQDDPSGVSVREKSNSFPCSVIVKSGKTTFGGGKFSTVALQITSLAAAAVQFTANATS